MYHEIFKFIILPLVLICFGLSPVAHAVVPPPDGGYPNGNTAEGHEALFSLTTGSDNTAIGFRALFSTVGDIFGHGNRNTAIGSQALISNTTGSGNTATGFSALFFNQTGADNTATGLSALSGNTTGKFNTATGVAALGSNTTGSFNTATGEDALAGAGGNQTGSNNTATGFDALFNNAIGDNNTVTGFNALRNNISGDNNTAIGSKALFNATGSNNIALGLEAGFNLTTGSFNIDIGNVGVAGEANTIRVGTTFSVDFGSGQNKTFIAGIRGITTGNADALAVVIDSAGQLGTVSSSERFKKDIGPMNKASEAILALKPVTFHYKQDTKGIAQFGLIAEDVAKVNPDLVVRDKNDEIYTVRYDAVNAMLLNEFLKEHQKVQKLEAALAAVTERLKEQDAKIDKVNAKVELTNLAPQVANNGQ